MARTQHTGTGAGTGYYHSDGNGNVTAMLAPDGQSLLAAYLYDPYGRTLQASGTWASANVYRFSSKEQHAASGLYYYGFRFYSPNLQRWVNRDPIQEEGGINLFKFIKNSPSSFVDADGRHPILIALVLLIVFEQTIDRPPDPPPGYSPLPPLLSNPIPPGTPTIGPCRDYTGSGLLSAVGGSHLIGTEMGTKQTEFIASAITAPLPLTKVNSLRFAAGTDDILVLGRGPLERLQRLAMQEGGRVSTIDSTVAREIFRNNYRDIRTADRIIQYMDNIPTTLQESLQIGGQYSRAEVFMINQRKDLLQKTIRKWETPPCR